MITKTIRIIMDYIADNYYIVQGRNAHNGLTQEWYIVKKYRK